MATGDFLNIHPSELKFPFELRKQSSCTMQVTNKTTHYIAFKVKTTNPKKYCVRPNVGVVLPASACNIVVTMQAQKVLPPDFQCKDKFLIQSVIAPTGATAKDVSPELFDKEEGKLVDEFKIRVVYIPANPPSPVPEGSEEGSSPRAPSIEDRNQSPSLVEAVTESLDGPREKTSSSEAVHMISKLADEKVSLIQQGQKLGHELDMMRKEIRSRQGSGVSFFLVVLVGLLGCVVGYLMKRT